MQSHSAVFNLCATICGGGVLSLPYAIGQLGFVAGPLVLALVAIITDASLQLLITTARKLNGLSYEDLAVKTFGRVGEIITVVLLFVMLLPSSVAYLVLVADLEVPLVEYLFNNDEALGPAARPLAMAITLTAVSPFCFQDSLHALRFTSFISFASTLLLAGAVILRATQCATGWGNPPEECGAGPDQGDSLGPKGVRQVLLAVPVFATSFLCHFNVLPVHNEIYNAHHMRAIVHWTIGIVLALYLLVGIGGFYVGRERTCGNVLLNFPADDGAMALGRAGLVVTLSMSLPLLTVPCRNTMLRLMDLITCDWTRGRRRRRSSV